MELEEDFQLDVPQVNIDKIMAAITILTTDDFFNSLPRFARLVNVLADDEFDPAIFDPADCLEMAWAITEVMLLRGQDDVDDEPFSEEIRFYIGHMLTEEGIVNPPDVLQIAIKDTVVEDPLANFDTDPAMYQGFYESQAAKSQDITSSLQRQLNSLIQELRSLKLENGDTAQLLQQLRNSI